MSEMKKCPFCPDGIGILKDRYIQGIANRKTYWVECNKCQARIQNRRSAKRAVEAWNADYRCVQPENEPLTCKDCVYWKDRQVQLRDGSRRDYLPNEPWSVTADVGINVASHCTLHGFDNESGSWFWAKAEDFCSLGIRKPERSEGE